MMERLQALFLGDGVIEVKFRWLVFYGVTVAGLAYVPLQSWFFLGVLGYWEVPLYPFHYIWIIFASVGALLAFKPIKRARGEYEAHALATS